MAPIQMRLSIVIVLAASFIPMAKAAAAVFKAENLKCLVALGKVEFANSKDKWVPVARHRDGLKEYVWDGRAIYLLIRPKAVPPSLDQKKDLLWSMDEMAKGGDGRVPMKTKGMKLGTDDIALMQLTLIREAFLRLHDSKPTAQAYREALMACRDVQDVVINHRSVGTLSTERLESISASKVAPNGQGRDTRP